MTADTSHSSTPNLRIAHLITSLGTLSKAYSKSTKPSHFQHFVHEAGISSWRHMQLVLLKVRLIILLCFMNKVLKVTSPSANSKNLDPSAFLYPYPKPPCIPSLPILRYTAHQMKHFGMPQIHPQNCPFPFFGDQNNRN